MRFAKDETLRIVGLVLLMALAFALRGEIAPERAEVGAALEWGGMPVVQVEALPAL